MMVLSMSAIWFQTTERGVTILVFSSSFSHLSLCAHACLIRSCIYSILFIPFLHVSIFFSSLANVLHPSFVVLSMYRGWVNFLFNLLGMSFVRRCNQHLLLGLKPLSEVLQCCQVLYLLTHHRMHVHSSFTFVHALAVHLCTLNSYPFACEFFQCFIHPC